jgi:hypothetical protein
MRVLRIMPARLREDRSNANKSRRQRAARTAKNDTKTEKEKGSDSIHCPWQWHMEDQGTSSEALT